jgi:hypothetical protein
MSGTTPNFEYWRKLDAYSIFELACLFNDIDPRGYGEVANREGDVVDLTEEIEHISRASIAQLLDIHQDVSGPIDQDSMVLKNAKLFQWLKKIGFNDLADTLSATQKNESSQPEPWIAEAVRLADQIALERWKNGQATSAQSRPRKFGQ